MLTIPEEMIIDGAKCEASRFRASIFLMIAFKIWGKILNISIEAKHVQNKVKRLKDKYENAYNMINTSVFSWDDKKKKCCLDTIGFAFYGFLLWKHLHATY